MQQIATRARVSPATVYAQCGGKQGLLKTLMDAWTAGPLVLQIIEACAAAGTGAEKLRVLADGYVAIYAANGDIIRIVTGAAGAAPDAAEFAEPPSRLAAPGATLTIGYAGNLFIRDYFEMLGELAAALRRINGRIVIYGPVTAAEFHAKGLAAENIELRGMVGSCDLILRLREEVDALFVPMSFTAADRCFSEFSFPSKLTDYTATGVPLLVQGPAYSSVVKWCEENAGVAEIVTQVVKDVAQ